MRPANFRILAVKELRSLLRDPMLLLLIFYALSGAIYIAATAMPDTLNKAAIAIVDEDRSAVSGRLADAFYPPHFLTPRRITPDEMDVRMDGGLDTFALHIPAGFQQELLAGRSPTLQLNVDATRMSQAYIGSAYIQSIVGGELQEYLDRERSTGTPAVSLALRARFNPELNESWFGSVMELISNITMLSIILTGAALIREREHGTIEHLLVMPVTPFQIMGSKVVAMGLVVLLAASLSLLVVIQGLLHVPIEGSIALFLIGAALLLFATTSMGIFLGTVARSMPQFGLLMLLILMPLEILSGGMTPRESMPDVVRWIMLAAPTTHFVTLAQAVLFRGAGFSIVWPQFLALLTIGTALFSASLVWFRKALARMA
jgi:ABC-2 type transport system permease protein